MGDSRSTPQNLSKRSECEVAIIGGGVAGGLAAIHLARAGVHVVLFEQNEKPTEKTCGEFISYEALPLLREVGLEPLNLGGVEITDFRLHGPHYTSELKFPRRAVALPRLRLDTQLLEIAAASGAEIRRGVTVGEVLEGLDETTGSILLSTSEGEIRAQRVMVATGKTEFKSLNARIGRDNSYAGFKICLKLKPSCAKALRHHVDVFVFDRGYGALTDLGDGFASFAFVIEKDVLKNLGTDWGSLSTHIGKSCWRASHYLDGAEPQAKHLYSVNSIPYGFIRRAPAPIGFFFLGDQMAVLPSMTGEGIAIALMTARAAAHAMLEDSPKGSRLRFAAHASRNYQREMRAMIRPQMDAALALQAVFKNPKLIDVSTFALNAFPSIFKHVFKSTRCRALASAKAPIFGTGLKKSPDAPVTTPLIGH